MGDPYVVFVVVWRYGRRPNAPTDSGMRYNVILPVHDIYNNRVYISYYIIIGNDWIR